MKYEEKILTHLVENYRKSKKDSGDNKNNRRTQVQPEKLYAKYKDNGGNLEEISKLNQAVSSLMEKGFVTSTQEAFGTEIECIYLVDGSILDAEQYLSDKYGYISKDTQLQKLRILINKYRNTAPICDKECARLDAYIAERKVPKNIDELDNVLKAVSFVETNKEDLYVREVSMRVYGDSKFFEDETIQLVCKVLRKYLDRPVKDDELPDEILLHYHIAKEPQKLCIKGKAIITINQKDLDISDFSGGVEFLASDLVNIQSIKILTSTFMTIENRTSYLRYKENDTVTFFLGGYANRHQRDFIRLVYASNSAVRYKHFGDIDAGGLWIHHNLCDITGVKFSLYCMSVDELKKPAYESCLHTLTDNDIIRLRELQKMDIYKGVVDYMLEHSAKLEQEIVSLQLMESV